MWEDADADERKQERDHISMDQIRHAENWKVICYPPIFHSRNSEYGKWGEFLQKEKNQIHPLLFLMHLIFLVF